MLEPRLVEITDAKTREYYDQIIGFQRSILPELKEMEEIAKQQAELQERNKQLIAVCAAADAKAKRVKDKIVPRLQRVLKKDMGDLDEFIGMDIVDGKLYAKIVDKVEQYRENLLKQREEALASKGS